MKSVTALLMSVALVGLAGPTWADDDFEFEAELSGAQEPPPGVETDGRGEVDADFDDELSRVRVRLRVKDTNGTPMRAHFHCARPGQNGPIAFGIVDPGPCEFDDDGRVRCTLTNEDANAGNTCMDSVGRPVNNIASLAFAMRDGLIYVNVHTSTSPGGELRGQMVPED